jgi:uncharacterized protein YggE
MKLLIPAAVFAGALLVGSAAAARAQEGPDAGPQGMGPGMMLMSRGTTLAISAFGEVKAAPDMATISLGVQTQAGAAADAMSQNAAQMSRIIEALKHAGISDKDIQTSGLSLNAQYAYEQDKPPRLTGYQASNQVTINVNDLGKLGRTLDATVAAGANQINGVTFGLREPAAAEDVARRKAVETLQARAKLYAGATGLHVGRLINLSEGSSIIPPRPLPVMAMRAVAAAPVTPVEGGQIDVRVDVSALYELTK